ncbi:MAG: hemolysin III family protein [Anaerolineaceae bacterium]|nr:hemolysin III family protein [Anaerolineaceae bacterium]
MSYLSKTFREPLSGLTHLVGALLALIGAIDLLVPAIQSRNTLQIIAFSVYGASLLALYSASSAYHLLNLSESGTRTLRRLDHTMIYILIAGSYTPLCLIALRGAWGWSLLGVVWGLALAGFILTLFYLNKSRWLTVGIYILMGWLAVVAFVPLLQRVPAIGIFWMVLGGVIYSGGAIVYARKRPDPIPGVFGFHELWHLFVMAGSAAHFVLIFSVIRFL